MIGEAPIRIGTGLGVLVALAVLTTGMVEAQSSSRGSGDSASSQRSATSQQSTSTSQSQRSATSSPGRYRSTGRYRGAQPNPPPTRPYASSQSVNHLSFTGSNAGARYQQLLDDATGRVHRRRPVYRPLYVVADPEPAPQVIYVQPPPQPPVYVVIESPQQAEPEVESRPAEPLPPPPPPAVEGSATYTIVPADATVYLDDRLLGTGAELTGQGTAGAGAGVHVLEVSHPDHGTERVIFGIDGNHVSVTVDLTESRPGRRIRVQSGG